MAGVMLRGLPDLPWISAFPEINVRTYVEHNGRPGVWFLSLDATQPLAVWAAQTLFHLPYFRAAMSVDNDSARVHYRSARDNFRFEAAYGPTSAAFRSQPGSLDHWLTERYCLFAADRAGALWRTDVHHQPWPLQRAESEIRVNTMLSAHGVSVDGAPVIQHFARRIEVVAWPSERVG
jgi:uncharacterized protein YqjF (DUF2071 family)